MAYCLPKTLASELKRRIKEWEAHPRNLVKMTSEQRRGYFESFLGKENAKNINALFESKLELKNIQQGMKNWVEQSFGLKKQVKRDIISKIEKMDKLLNPEDMKQFRQDLVDRKLWVSLSIDEAKTIWELSKSMQESKKWIDWEPNGSWKKIDYGIQFALLKNYVSEIKKNALEPVWWEWLKPYNIVEWIASFSKSIKAAWDNSFLGRQGIKRFYTNPIQFAKEAKVSYQAIMKELKWKDWVLAVQADVYSRDNMLNDAYRISKLDIGLQEEMYPDTFLWNIPLLWKVYKASESAFKATALRMRADIFDEYYKIWEKAGSDMNDPEVLQSIWNLANSMTGRGSLWKFEWASKTINLFLFSAKMMKSNLDFLTAHIFDSKMNWSWRKEAAKNLLKVIVWITSVLAIAKAINNDSVSLDPTSSDFWKIRIWDTRFDISGGMSVYAVLAARLLMWYSTSSTTGKISKTWDYWVDNWFDLIMKSLIENKLSPFASTIKDLINRKDASWKPISLQNELVNLFWPLPVTNAVELWNNPKAAPFLWSLLLDIHGIGANTYSSTTKPWAKPDIVTKMENKYNIKQSVPDKVKELKDKYGL